MRKILLIFFFLFYNFSLYSQALYITEDNGMVPLQIIKFYEKEIQKELSKEREVIPLELFIEKGFQKNPLCDKDVHRLKEFNILKEKIENAKKAFYEENDIEKSEKLLDEAMEAFFNEPCVVADNQQFMKDIFQFGVFKIWLRTIKKNEEGMKDFIKKIVLTFPDEKPSLEDFPPEVCRKYDEMKKIFISSFGAIEVRFFPSDIEKQCKTYLNGREIGVGNITIPKIISGKYLFQPFCEGIGGFKRNIEIKDKKILINVIWPLEKNFIIKERVIWKGVLHKKKEIEYIGKAFFEYGGFREIFIGRFIYSKENKKASVTLFKYDIEKNSFEMGSVTEFFDNSKPPPAPKFQKLEKKGSNLFGWILLGTGIGFSGAGIYFNILSQKNVNEINRGINSLDNYKINKTLMWTFYGIGSASIVGSIVIFFIEKQKTKESFWEKISFSSSFDNSVFLRIKF